jgi:cell division protein FtsQ
MRRWMRRASIVAAGVGVVLLCCAGWWLQRSGTIGALAIAAERNLMVWSAGCGLAVADVQVVGRERASRAAILSALGVTQGTPILAVDPPQAKRRLESLGWIRAASVERRLPDTLYIRIVERQPLAFWQRQGKLVVVDRDGVVVASDRLADYGSLIVLVGGDAPKHGPALIDMLATEPELAPHVAAAVRVGGRRWNLRFDNGIDVQLPEEEATAAWHRLAELERRHSVLERAVEAIDLRLPDRLVLRAPSAEAPKPPAKKNRQPGKTT